MYVRASLIAIVWMCVVVCCWLDAMSMAAMARAHLVAGARAARAPTRPIAAGLLANVAKLRAYLCY